MTQTLPARNLESASVAISHTLASYDLAAGGPSSGATRRRTVAAPLDGMQRLVAQPGTHVHPAARNMGR